MSHSDSYALMVAPTLSEAVGAVFTEEERDTLKANLRTEQVAQAKYLRAHPEIRSALQEGLRRVLQEQPEDPVAVLTRYYMSDEFVNYQIGSAPPA